MFRSRAVTALAVGSALSIAAIACGSDNPGAPAAGGDGNDGGSGNPTPPPAPSIQSGYDAVRSALEAKGVVVVRAGEDQSGLFANPYTKVLINGEQVDIYEFMSVTAADAAALTVSEDGTTYTQDDSAPIAIDFKHLPHLFKQGNVIVVYTGGDAATINLLRDTLGQEFAGDRSPVDPGKTDSPGYEVVVEPAPIESVEIFEDPDNPGFFSLRVVTGLPNGCTRFHDISVTQTGELELTLQALNTVPAPGQMIACTEIYGFVDHTVPLGTTNDNLDACEVYTVRWNGRDGGGSLRFQATAPNIRCADPGLPTDGGGDGPIVNPIISDLDALILSLRHAGIEIERSTEQGTKLFRITSEVVLVNGQRIEIFSFGPGIGALLAASGVSLDGFEILDHVNFTAMNVSWVSTPHFYLAGNSILLYVGVDEEIVATLDRFAGQKFAGPGAKPVELPDDRPAPLPLPPEMDVILVPAPIVKVGDIAIAESFPPQYFLQVTTAQPTGCDQDAGWGVIVNGTDVFVEVQNTQPADLSVVLCAAVYGETEHNVRLGSGEFESGVEYIVHVNGKVFTSFTAQ